MNNARARAIWQKLKSRADATDLHALEAEYRRQLARFDFGAAEIDAIVAEARSRDAVARLVDAGAAFVHSPGAVPMPVGLMFSTAPRRWFWWEVGGETEFHGHVFDCEHVEIVSDGAAVIFTARNRSAGCLMSFARTFEGDRAAAAHRLFGLWRAEYNSNESLRAFIAAESRR